MEVGKVRWDHRWVLGRRPCQVLKNESVNRLRWWCEGLEKGELVMVEGGWVGVRGARPLAECWDIICGFYLSQLLILLTEFIVC